MGDARRRSPPAAAGTPELEGISGRYFVGRRERRSSRVSYDPDAQRRLWDASQTLLARRAVRTDRQS